MDMFILPWILQEQLGVQHLAQGYFNRHTAVAELLTLQLVDDPLYLLTHILS